MRRSRSSRSSARTRSSRTSAPSTARSRSRAGPRPCCGGSGTASPRTTTAASTGSPEGGGSPLGVLLPGPGRAVGAHPLHRQLVTRPETDEVAADDVLHPVERVRGRLEADVERLDAGDELRPALTEVDPARADG